MDGQTDGRIHSLFAKLFVQLIIPFTVLVSCLYRQKPAAGRLCFSYTPPWDLLHALSNL